MLITITELESGIRKISLGGRMDIVGTQVIETRFTAAAASEPAKIIIDLTNVEFMASIGMGVIIRAANAQKMNEGNVVLFNPPPNVKDALEKTLIHTVIPIVYDMDSALALLNN